MPAITRVDIKMWLSKREKRKITDSQNTSWKYFIWSSHFIICIYMHNFPTDEKKVRFLLEIFPPVRQNGSVGKTDSLNLFPRPIRWRGAN